MTGAALFCICYDNYFSYRTVDEWMHYHSDNHQFLRKAANYQDKDNTTPLFWLSRKYTPLYTYRRVLQLAHETAKIQRKSDGWLPIHMTIFNRASPKIINLLLKAYPLATKVNDNSGLLGNSDKKNIAMVASGSVPVTDA
jgi:hypothetical protein